MTTARKTALATNVNGRQKATGAGRGKGGAPPSIDIQTKVVEAMAHAGSPNTEIAEFLAENKKPPLAASDHDGLQFILTPLQNQFITDVFSGIYLAVPFCGRSPVSSDLRDRLPATLGSAYTLEHELGEGGMSRVFAATETAHGRKVVVEVLPPELAEGVSVERFNERFSSPPDSRTRISSRSSAGEMSGLPYYMMPLVNGDSLRTRLSTGTSLPISDVDCILRDVARTRRFSCLLGVRDS